MQKIKTISVLASFILAFTLAAPFTLAEDQYLPDVENFAGESVSGGVRLTWDSAEGADSYTIYYGAQSISEDGASYEENIMVGNVNEYTLEDLMSGTMYYFAVAADDSTGTHLGSYNYSEEISLVADGEAPAPEEAPVGVEPPEEFPEEVIPEEEPSALVSLLDEGEHTSANEPTVDPENLSQSGPAMVVFALVSGTGAYFWRRFRK
ncbi:fibronectin type III domain-containing protein [Candidatus Gracilibacteria bacterium]|nr:fibronectin type III domain-containing protein [Candidatus Gracilibacteria bacterium]